MVTEEFAHGKFAHEKNKLKKPNLQTAGKLSVGELSGHGKIYVGIPRSSLISL